MSKNKPDKGDKKPKKTLNSWGAYDPVFNAQPEKVREREWDWFLDMPKAK